MLLYTEQVYSVKCNTQVIESIIILHIIKLSDLSLNIFEKNIILWFFITIQ